MATKYRKHFCSLCGKCVDSWTREQQDQHEKECSFKYKPQMKLDAWEFDKAVVKSK